MKHQESINYQKMANRMEAISSQIKTNMNNTKVRARSLDDSETIIKNRWLSN